MKTIIVTDNPAKWGLQLEGVEVVQAEKYLTEEVFISLKKAKIFNFCRSYKYQSIGYYVSLIAEARGHHPLPRVTTIQDMQLGAVIRDISSDLDALIQKSLSGRIQSEKFELSVYFGHSIANCYNTLARNLFNLIPTPFFKANFLKDNNMWYLDDVNVIATKDIPESHHAFVIERIKEFVERKSHKIHGKTSTYKYKMAILLSPSEPNPASNAKAIEQFRLAADKQDMGVEIIDKNDYAFLDRFDALFIRDTTAVNHYTYRFARKAEKSGLIVMDDPLSILRCTNKIYLTELLRKNHVAIPKSLVISRNNVDDISKYIGFPCVAKVPDSSFSQGVYKYSSMEEFMHAAPNLFAKTDLLLVQSFVPTEFDWRVGVLNNRPLFVCRYYMVSKYWKVYNHDQGERKEGDSDTMSVYEAPHKVIETALKATSLIGNGLYGVDVKEIGKEPAIIEVNDNPNIDYGTEDKVLKRELYDTIISEFIRRIELQN